MFSKIFDNRLYCNIMSSNLVFTGTRKLIFIESLLSSNSNLATFEVSIPLSS